MQLQAYFDRIGYDGPAHADADVLKAVHRAHVEAVPYENLDVQLGTPVSRSARSAYDKIVTRRRGGWCYEMNGLLGWALEEIGFKVRRLAGAVARDERGDGAIGNHLVLIVDLGEPWLADAGFGDGLIEAIPLKTGAFRNGPFHCRLEDIGGGWMRYHNDPRGGGPTFDFNLDVTDEALLEKLCGFLQTSEDSPFVQNAVAQRWLADQHICMRGKVFTALSADEKFVETITDAQEYVAALKERFGLDLSGAASLWPKICARHEAVFGAAATS